VHRPLDHVIGVRTPASQPALSPSFSITCIHWLEMIGEFIGPRDSAAVLSSLTLSHQWLAVVPGSGVRPPGDATETR
jgi:hypothetical protein